MATSGSGILVDVKSRTFSGKSIFIITLPGTGVPFRPGVPSFWLVRSHVRAAAVPAIITSVSTSKIIFLLFIRFRFYRAFLQLELRRLLARLDNLSVSACIRGFSLVFLQPGPNQN